MREHNSSLRSVAEAIHLIFARLPRRLRLLAMTSSFIILSGCSTISGWADNVGKHMPTIGEPCYHWQCFTESGQRKSDELKKIEEKPKGKTEGEIEEDSKTPSKGSVTPLSINN